MNTLSVYDVSQLLGDQVQYYSEQFKSKIIDTMSQQKDQPSDLVKDSQARDDQDKDSHSKKSQGDKEQSEGEPSESASDDGKYTKTTKANQELMLKV